MCCKNCGYNTGSCTCSSSKCSSSNSNAYTKVSWPNVTDTPTWLSQDNTVISKTVEIPSAQVLTMFSNEVEIIPFPNSTQKLIDIVSAYAINDFGTIPYVNAGANRMVLKYNTAAEEIMGIAGGIVSASADQSARFIPKDSVNNVLLNKSVVAAILNANPTAGDGNIKIVVNYRVIIVT